MTKEKKKNIIKNQAKNAKGFVGEFKKFVLRGNVLDLAVGVIIGAAFQSIVTSLTNNIISPILGIFGKVNFTEFKLVLNENAAIAYGAFITDVINFIIMAFGVFVMIKLINKISSIGKKEEIKEEPKKPTLTKDQELLIEIRDLLKEKKN